MALENNQGNPMSNGYNQAAETLANFVQRLDTTMGSIQSQLSGIYKALGGQEKFMERISRNTEISIQETEKERKDISEYLKKIQKEQERLHDTQAKLGDSKRKDTITTEAKELESIASKLEAFIKLQKSVPTPKEGQRTLFTKEQAEVLKSIGVTNVSKEGYSSSDIKQLFNYLEDSLRRSGSQTFADIQNRRSEERSLDDRIRKLSKIGSSGIFQNAGFERLAREQEKLGKAEEFAEEIEELRNTIKDSIDAIKEKMETADDEQRAVLKKQLSIAEEQEKHLKKLKPINDSVKQFTSGVKGTLINTAMNMLTGLTDHLQNRYLDAYVEGFSRVYQSIETTRNSISARSKLDAGGFQNLQDTIHERLESENLTGAISSVDVNEAIVRLNEAGITNEETMTELALEYAKLKATGSSINLMNEEMLTNIATSLNQGNELSDIITMLDEIEVGVQHQREETGQDIAFVNGGIDTLINSVLKTGVTYEQSVSQMSSNMQDAIQIASASQGIGIDPNTFIQNLHEISQQDIQNLPVWQQAIYSSLNADTLATMSYEDATQTILNTLKQYMPKDMTMAQLSAVNSSLGTSFDMQSLKRLQNNNFDLSSKATKLGTQELTDKVSHMYDNLEDYISETEKVNTKYENYAYEEAKTAEKMYEGDKLILKEMESVRSGVKSMIGLLGTLVAQGSKSLFSGRGGSPTTGTQLPSGGTAGTGTPTVGGGVSSWSYGQSTGNVGFDFLTGARGTTAGTVGRVGMAGYGAFNLFKTVGDNVVYDEQGAVDVGETIQQTILDENAWKSSGEMIGGAVGGPIAGYIMGELWGGALKIGKEIGAHAGDSITETMYEKALNKLGDENKNLADSYEKQVDASDKQIQAIEELIKASDQLDKTNLAMSLVQDFGYDYASISDKSTDDLRKLYKKQLYEKQKHAEYEKASSEVQGRAASWRSGNVSALTTLGKLTTKGGELYLGDATLDESGVSANYAHALSSFEAEGNIGFLDKVAEQVKLEEAYGDGRSRSDIIKSLLGSDTTNEQVSNVEALLSEHASWVDKYNSANDKFHRYWGYAKDLSKSEEPMDIYNMYISDEFSHAYTTETAKNLPIEVLSSTNLKDGVPNLPKTGGRFPYDPALYKGKFASGLTRVPSDGYEAILHTGERVLTKREAEVYNTIVPDLVEAVTNTYNTYSSNSSSGSSGVKDEISSQTNSLVDVLNKILDVLTSMNRGRYTNPLGVGISNAFLNMNSDVTQTSTSYR